MYISRKKFELENNSYKIKLVEGSIYPDTFLEKVLKKRKNRKIEVAVTGPENTLYFIKKIVIDQKYVLFGPVSSIFTFLHYVYLSTLLVILPLRNFMKRGFLFFVLEKVQNWNCWFWSKTVKLQINSE